ncbi:hypothetical protein [Carnimonas bestiolae]|uniref:hypothetical protein n=1 Tax=Carnimonas bestiolae TaxID=3402172 RepID=UPI003EDBF8EF
MGLHSNITNALERAFAGPLADAVKPFTGVHIVRSFIDPVTEEGRVETVEYKGQGVFDNFDLTVVDGVNIEASDQQLIALASQCERQPEVGDKINGYEVKAIQIDPANVSYTALLRRI